MLKNTTFMLLVALFTAVTSFAPTIFVVAQKKKIKHKKNKKQRNKDKQNKSENKVSSESANENSLVFTYNSQEKGTLPHLVVQKQQQKKVLQDKGNKKKSEQFALQHFNFAEYYSLFLLNEIDIIRQGLKGVDVTQKNFAGQTLLHGLAQIIDCLTPEHLKLLKELGADVNARDNDGCTPLYLSCLRGVNKTTETLLDDPDTDISAPLTGEYDLMFYAVFKSDLRLIDLLLNRNYVNGSNRALCESIRHEKNEFFKKLLTDKKVDCSQKNHDGLTALHFAAQFDATLEFIQLLDTKKIAVNVQDNELSTPLHYAASAGACNVLSFLFKCKKNEIDLNQKDRYGLTSLHLAAMAGMSGAVKMLCEQGADLNSQDLYGRTPLLMALKYNFKDACETLCGKTCQHTCLSIDEHHEVMQVIKTLIDSGAKLESKDVKGRGVVHYAALYCKMPNVFNFLIRSGLDCNQRGKQGESAFAVACRRKNINIAKLLACHLDFQFDVQDKHGYASIHHALYTRDLDLIKLLLLKCPLLITLPIISGQLPLHCACNLGSYEVAELLIEKEREFTNQISGPLKSFYFRDRADLMPLDYAVKSGNKKLVQLLLDQGCTDYVSKALALANKLKRFDISAILAFFDYKSADEMVSEEECSELYASDGEVDAQIPIVQTEDVDLLATEIAGENDVEQAVPNHSRKKFEAISLDSFNFESVREVLKNRQAVLLAQSCMTEASGYSTNGLALHLAQDSIKINEELCNAVHERNLENKFDDEHQNLFHNFSSRVINYLERAQRVDASNYRNNQTVQKLHKLELAQHDWALILPAKIMKCDPSYLTHKQEKDILDQNITSMKNIFCGAIVLIFTRNQETNKLVCKHYAFHEYKASRKQRQTKK